jgi:hypothetical protein
MKQRHGFSFRPLFVVVALIGASAACTNSMDPMAPSPTTGVVPSVNATWTGTASDNIDGSGTVTAVIMQSGSNLTGTWVSSFSGTSGTLSGTVNGTSVMLMLMAPTVTTCSLAVTATLDNTQSHMIGSFTTLTCSESVMGTIALMKDSGM